MNAVVADVAAVAVAAAAAAAAAAVAVAAAAVAVAVAAVVVVVVAVIVIVAVAVAAALVIAAAAVAVVGRARACRRENFGAAMCQTVPELEFWHFAVWTKPGAFLEKTPRPCSFACLSYIFLSVFTVFRAFSASVFGLQLGWFRLWLSSAFSFLFLVLAPWGGWGWGLSGRYHGCPMQVRMGSEWTLSWLAHGCSEGNG